MAVTNFIPELWNAQLLSSLKKNLVYGSSAIVNRDYEGEIRNAGDTVRITSVARPTIIDYVKNSTVLTPQTLTDAQRSLEITQAKAFVFEIDDIDYRQAVSGGALMAEAANEAAYGLADAFDQFIISLYGDVTNTITTTQVNDAAKAVAALVAMKVKLDEANVPTAQRYVVIPPWFHGLLLASDLFVRVDASGTSEALRNGLVGRAFGFDVYVSNNAPVITGDDYAVLGGVPGAITVAEQIVKTEAFRPESAFSDALKGLHVYGAKVVRPDAAVVLTASKT